MLGCTRAVIQPLAKSDHRELVANWNQAAYDRGKTVYGQLCVTCHGESLAPDVQERLAERYPTDRATGYRVGDLRGVFWAELPPARHAR